MPSRQPPAPSATAIRRAVEADAPMLAAILPQGASRGDAAFLLEDADGVIGALTVSQGPDRLWIEALAVAPGKRRRGHGTTLLAFAEAAAREVGLRSLEVRTMGAESFFARHGFAITPTIQKKLPRGGAFQRAMRHLEAVGVPLLKIGSAPPGRTLYYRGVWTGLSLLAGLGSLSLAAHADAPTLGRLVFAAALAAACILFALWQSCLMIATPRSIATTAAGAIAALAVAIAVYGKGAPQLGDIVIAYRAGAAAGDLAVVVDGATLALKGTPGKAAEAAVRRALEASPAIREVVLEGGGDRLDPAYGIYRLIHNRRLATRVDRTCVDACTIMFLGGVDRSISAEAVLSFRQAGLPGMDRVDAYERNQQLERLLAVQAGLAPSFVQRVLATPPGSVWTPSIDELLAGRVIQRVGPAREQAR